MRSKTWILIAFALEFACDQPPEQTADGAAATHEDGALPQLDSGRVAQSDATVSMPDGGVAADGGVSDAEINGRSDAGTPDPDSAVALDATVDGGPQNGDAANGNDPAIDATTSDANTSMDSSTDAGAQTDAAMTMDASDSQSDSDGGDADAQAQSEGLDYLCGYRGHLSISGVILNGGEGSAPRLVGDRILTSSWSDTSSESWWTLWSTTSREQLVTARGEPLAAGADVFVTIIVDKDQTSLASTRIIGSRRFELRKLSDGSLVSQFALPGDEQTLMNYQIHAGVAVDGSYYWVNCFGWLIALDRTSTKWLEIGGNYDHATKFYGAPDALLVGNGDSVPGVVRFPRTGTSTQVPAVIGTLQEWFRDGTRFVTLDSGKLARVYDNAGTLLAGPTTECGSGQYNNGVGNRWACNDGTSWKLFDISTGQLQLLDTKPTPATGHEDWYPVETGWSAHNRPELYRFSDTAISVDTDAPPGVSFVSTSETDALLGSSAAGNSPGSARLLRHNATLERFGCGSVQGVSAVGKHLVVVTSDGAFIYDLEQDKFTDYIEGHGIYRASHFANTLQLNELVYQLDSKATQLGTANTFVPGRLNRAGNQVASGTLATWQVSSIPSGTTAWQGSVLAQGPGYFTAPIVLPSPSGSRVAVLSVGGDPLGRRTTLAYLYDQGVVTGSYATSDVIGWHTDDFLIDDAGHTVSMQGVAAAGCTWDPAVSSRRLLFSDMQLIADSTYYMQERLCYLGSAAPPPARKVRYLDLPTAIVGDEGVYVARELAAVFIQPWHD